MALFARLFVLFLCLGLTAELPCAAAEWSGARWIDEAVEEAIESGQIPGAVALVGQGDRILHHRAYGNRTVAPGKQPMRLDTIFDCASLTKVVATTPSIMKLVEQGKVRLRDRVTQYIPEFADGRSSITVRQLLTHTSGLRPDLDLEPEWEGYETGIVKSYKEVPQARPDQRFIYSDINFILLAEIVSRVSGQRIHEYAAENVFAPLGMDDTGYVPDAALRDRIAPTTRMPDGTILQGIVHDPTTRYMGGVAGHAGMFSTAADLSRYARMMLHEGRLEDVRLLSPLSVDAMTRTQTPEGVPARGLGWDLHSPYASVRGDLYPGDSYGHTGYTGTSLWIDPGTDSYVILLTNRAHPTDSGSVVSLRSRVSSIVAAAISSDAAASPTTENRRATRRTDGPRNGQVLTGLDVLVRDGFAPLAGKRVGLITNHTGIDRVRRRGVDLFAQADNLELAAVFTPEHGLDGVFDQEHVADAKLDQIPVYSLYQPGRRRPTAEMLQGLDALVFDIQDIGARFYTYSTTMAYALEEAAKADIEFWVLDRPNPITGTRIEGPVIEDELRSFIGYLRIPVRHGMTMGELARFHNETENLGADLHVVAMEAWDRAMWFDETGLPWVNPSPNMRTLQQALLYPGVALLEGLRNYSVGRGTDTPFEFVGADWIDGEALARELASVGSLGVYPMERTPDASNFKGTSIEGVALQVLDRERFRSLDAGLALAEALGRLYATRIDWDRTGGWIGRSGTVDELASGAAGREILETWRESSERFRSARRPFLLYPEPDAQQPRDSALD